jgi:hypothetical protein
MESIQEVNLQELEEKYGGELAKEIEDNINYCTENNQNFKIEVIRESDYFYTVVFATKSYTHLYDVSKRRKKISDKSFFGIVDARQALEIMESL